MEGQPATPQREQVRSREDSVTCPIEGAVHNEYQVRIVSPEGRGIPNALLRYSAWDQVYTGNQQIVATDSDGNCTLVEELLPGQEKKYYDNVLRWLHVDIPGYAVGPVRFRPKKQTANIITAKAGGTIRGKFIDWNGNAQCGERIDVVYGDRRDKDFAEELSVSAAPDGTFAIGRIMPGEPMRLCHTGTQIADIWSETFTLMPGEIRKGVVLKASQSAALQGIVVDEKDAPVQAIQSVTFSNKYRGWAHSPPKTMAVSGRSALFPTFRCESKLELRGSIPIGPRLR